MNKQRKIVDMRRTLPLASRQKANLQTNTLKQGVAHANKKFKTEGLGKVDKHANMNRKYRTEESKKVAKHNQSGKKGAKHEDDGLDQSDSYDGSDTYSDSRAENNLTGSSSDDEKSVKSVNSTKSRQSKGIVFSL